MSEPTIEEQLAIVTNSRNALLLSNGQLYKENQKALADHAKALEKLQTDLDAANQDIANYLATIELLKQYRPYNPRILAGKAFYNRVSKEDMVTLLTSDNAMLVTVGKTIVAYAENDWPVILNSTDFQNLVGYVLQSGVFDEVEVTEIMRDATREEAYIT